MSSPRLLEQVRDRLRVKHYSMRTEDAYLHWIRRFIFFHGKRHAREMGGPQVEAFLSHLATDARVAASTQNQALSALLFLYREVLQADLPWLDGVVRAKRPKRVPVVARGIEPARPHRSGLSAHEAKIRLRLPAADDIGDRRTRAAGHGPAQGAMAGVEV